MPRLDRLRIYPVKGLDGIAVETSSLTPGGTLAGDREYALLDGGDPINGRDTPRVHDIDAEFDPATDTLRVATPNREPRTFRLPAETDHASGWFSDVFDRDLTLARNTETGYVDRQSAGPSVVSTATLREVASWFDDLSVESVRRRLRANVEIGDVPAFWEDRFVGVDAPAFTVGDVRFEGVTPCGRCVVPTRDPDTGEPMPAFRERFLERREATFPEWADPDAFDHYYTLMLISRIPDADRDGELQVGDPVEIVES